MHKTCGGGPLASARTGRWIHSNVPGGHIPDAIIERLEGAEDQKKEGRQICIDLIQEVKEIKGIAGIHVMAYRQEEFVSEIISASGVLNYRTLIRKPARRNGKEA